MQPKTVQIRNLEIARRAFLSLATAAWASAQTPTAAVMPPPAKAKITSSVMLWMLPGTFDQKVHTAALAGIQSVGLKDEPLGWDMVETRRAKRLIESFGMTTQTVAARSGSPSDLAQAIAAAKLMEAPYVLMASALPEDLHQAATLAANAEVTLLISTLDLKDSVQRLRDLDSSHVRLLFSTADERQPGTNVAPQLKEALDLVELVQIADSPGRSEPGTGTIDFKEIYRVLQKGGYTHVVSLEYRPKGDPVASLKRAVDQFRAAVNEARDAGTRDGGFSCIKRFSA